MNTIFNNTDYNNLVQRVNKLNGSLTPQWGKMNVAQMLAHCTVGLQMASGDIIVKRPFISYLVGRFMKKGFLSNKPVPKNVPTGKDFIMPNDKDFEQEKNVFLNKLKSFNEGGEAKATKHPHGFFGHLKPSEWGVGMYKHVDHHLQQFGV